MRLPFLILALLVPLIVDAAPPPDLAPIKRWISRQDEFHAVSADLKQTRSLKALKLPLVTPGHMWFIAPSTLRWELGDPVKLIVLRQGDSVYVVTPAKKHAEHFSPADAGKKPGVQSIATMNFQLAKDFAEYQRQYETLAVEVEGTRCHLEVAPRDPQVRRGVTAFKIDFDTVTNKMIVFEIVTRDGSSVRNEFSNVQVNPKIDRRTFEFDLSDYEVVKAE